MRFSNRTGKCLTVMCLAVCLTVCSATLGDDCDSKRLAEPEKAKATNGVETDSQAESAAASVQESKVDPVELARSLTNEDIVWIFNSFVPAIHFNLSDRARELESGAGWSARQSWEIRRIWLAGLKDPQRDEICHHLLTSVYDPDHTIGKRYFRLFKWRDARPAWNGRVLFRSENTQPTLEAERQMLIAAWRRRIRKWQDEQLLKDRDGPEIKEAIKVFDKKINSNTVDPQVLEHAHKIEEILDRRKDLNVGPVNALMPGIDPVRNPDGYRILKAAYLAGNIKKQIRTGCGEDCPLAGVKTMLDVYRRLSYVHLIEESEDLDQLYYTGQQNLKRAVHLMVTRASFPPPPPKPIPEDE